MAEADVDWAKLEGRTWRFQVPLKFHRKRGWTFVIAMPVLAVAITFLGWFMTPPDDVGNAILAVIAGLSFLGAGAGMLFGVFKLLTARGAEEKTRVTLDLDADLVGPGGSVPVAAIRSVELRQQSQMVGWRVLEVRIDPQRVRDDSPYRTPGRDAVVLIPRMSIKEDAWSLDLCRELGQQLGVPGNIGALTTTGGALNGGTATSGFFSQELAAGASWFPIQGIWFIASLAVLALDKRPLPRFHAKQSLLLGGVWFGLVVAAVVAMAGGAALLGDDAAPFIILPFAGLLLLAAMANLILRFVGAYKARRGEFWVFPGLGFARKWKDYQPDDT